MALIGPSVVVNGSGLKAVHHKAGSIRYPLLNSLQIGPVLDIVVIAICFATISTGSAKSIVKFSIDF